MADMEPGPFAQIPPSSAEPGPEPGRRLRRNVVAVGAAIGLTLGGLGVAAAQTDSPTPTPATPAAPAGDPKPGHVGRKHGLGLATAAKAIGISEADLQTALGNGHSLAQVAQAKGVDPATVITALVEEATAKLAEEVKAGRITQAQADERSADLQARVTEHVNRTGGPGKDGRGKGGHGKGGHGKGGHDKGGPGRKGHGPGLATAAKAIGISEADLLTELRAGKSIAQVAQAKGVDPAKVISAIVDEAKAKMAERAATLQERVTEHVNRVGGAGAERPGP